jgi:hypothetical protein
MVRGLEGVAAKEKAECSPEFVYPNGTGKIIKPDPNISE